MDAASFRAIGHQSLVAAGLGNDRVTVALEGDALILAGAAGARRALPVAEISRVGIGYIARRYARLAYEMRLWTAEAPEPLVLRAVPEDKPAFAVVARALADAIWSARGPGAVEGGLSDPPSIYLLLAAPVLLILVLLMQSLPGRHGHQYSHGNDLWLVELVGIPLACVGAWSLGFVLRPRPRPLSGPAELDAFLPGGPADV